MNFSIIIEICVAVDIAILGIAYPIIVDKISNIGEKYSSNYLAEIFKYEFPQESINYKFYKFPREISIFKLTLFSTIVSFVFLIFKIPPPSGFDNWFIENSANLIVFLFTVLLTIFFFIWLDKVVIYNGRSTILINHIIGKYKLLGDEDLSKKYFLKTINEISIYALNKPDTHIQESILQFYYEVFSRIRKNHNKNQPLVYPYDLYEFVYRLNQEASKNENEKLFTIGHRATSGTWLLGEDFEDVLISEETYKWLWRNVNVTHTKPRLIKSYWGTAHQYFDFQLKMVPQEYDYGTGKNKNQERIDLRNDERKKFLEFHYALGGLLLYSKQYNSINYIIKYSQSEPPRYVLLPDSNTDIFKWFDFFNNDLYYRSLPIDIEYFFPELDNLGNRNQVNYWVCSFLCLLFIRQFTLVKYYSFQNFTSLPSLPNNVRELQNWFNGLRFFESCLNDIISNKELLTALNYEKTVIDNKPKFEKFIFDLRKAIIVEIGDVKKNVPLSEEKVNLFNEKTKAIIKDAFDAYKGIFNKVSKQFESDLQKLQLTGIQTYFSKSDFTENDIPNLNFDSFLASEIANSIIKHYIPQTFLRTVAKRFLLNYNNLLEGFAKLKIDDNFIIVTINAYPQTIEILKGLNVRVENIPSTHNHLSNTIFILKTEDLPSIEHVDLPSDEIKEESLVYQLKDIHLYTSIVEDGDPNKVKIDPENVETVIPEFDIKVKVSIAFKAILRWKESRKIVQVNIETPFEEQGIPTRLNDIFPFDDLN